MQNSARLWSTFIVVCFIGAAITWFVRDRQHTKLLEQSRLDAPQRLRDFTAGMPSVYFVSIQGDVLTFSWAEQVKRGGETFLEQVQHIGRTLEPGVARAVGPALNYADLRPGQVLRLDMVADPTDPLRYLINAAFLIE